LTGLTIAQVVDATGIAEGTLRMWERRYGFPEPERLPSGHRRYSQDDVELVRRVVTDRQAGLSLPAAIDRVQRGAAALAPSVFAALRRSRPDLEARTLAKPLLLALTNAVEDESLSRADRPVLFGAFQAERFYRASQARWRELSHGAELAVAFADFERVRTPRDGPAEIPVERSHPLAREWTVVCCAPGHGVCLAGWEPPGRNRGERVFETIWSVEPDVVWEAARICAGIAAARRPALVEPVRDRLASEPGAVTTQQLRLATAITNRALAYLSSDPR
jgi:DICT domain-containing protein